MPSFTLEPWEDYEVEFLRETYPSKEWSRTQIAKKLGRSFGSVRQKALEQKLKRPAQAFPHKDNPDFIADVLSKQRIRGIMKKWGCSKTMVVKIRTQHRREALCASSTK